MRSALEATAIAAAATTVGIGATGVTLAYRLFQGPETGQLIIVFAFALELVAVIVGPVAVVLALLVVPAVERLRGLGWRRPQIAVCGASLFGVSYALLGAAMASVGLGRLFELRNQLIPVAAVSGAAAGLAATCVAWLYSTRQGKLTRRSSRRAPPAAERPR